MRSGRRLVTTSAAASLLALMCPVAEAQNYWGVIYNTSVDGALTGGAQTFEQCLLYVDSSGGITGGSQTITDDALAVVTAANGITGGTQNFQLNSGLDASVANAVTGGIQTFTTQGTLTASFANAVTGGVQIFRDIGFGPGGYGEAHVEAGATGGLSGATIQLYDNTFIHVAAVDAFGADASVQFNGSASSDAVQQLRLNGLDTTIGRIESNSGKSEISNFQSSDSSRLTVHSGSYSGRIFNGYAAGALSLAKAGAGTLTLSNNGNTYSGGTFVNEGTLVATVNGALGSGAVTIGSDGTLLVASTTLANSLAVSGTLTNGVGAIGTLTTGSQAWNSGGVYAWDINHAAATAGAGHDLLAINGSLTVASGASAVSQFAVAMNPAGPDGRLAGFESTGNYQWTLVTTTTGISGYDPGELTVDTSLLANAYNGTFSFGTSGNSLVLSYTGAPDIVHTGPSTSAIGNIGSRVRQITSWSFNVDTAGGFTGGETTFTGSQINVLHADAITGGRQKFNGPISGQEIGLRAARSITGGTQTFNGLTYVTLQANDAITGGLQTFNDGALYFHSLGGDAAGTISGGEQRFYGRADVRMIANSAITGGTQKFYNSSTLHINGGTISGGLQEFHDDSVLTLSSTTINGDTLRFYDNSMLSLNVGGTGEFTAANITHVLTSASFAPGAKLALDTTHATGGRFTHDGDIGGSIALAKLGPGTLVLGGTNTYGGGTTVSDGTLTAGGANAFGSGAVRVNAGTLNLGGFAITNALDVRGGSITGLAAYAGTQTVSGQASYSGFVSGTNLVANGGTLDTTGAAFTGLTTVQSGGTLKGTGTVGSLTIQSGGTLSPGNSPGLLTVNGDLTLDSDGATLIEIAGLTRGTTAGYDAINVSGTLTAGGTLTVSFFGGYTPSGSATFDFFNFASFGGSFAQINLPTVLGYTWNTSQLSTDGTVSLIASAIPEPGSWAALAAFAALASTACRRKRHHHTVA